MSSIDEVLTLDSRRLVYEFVQQHPGTHLREIARALDLPLGTALYHLDYLERRERLVVRRDGRYKRYFVANAFGRVEKDHVAALRHDVPRRIVSALLESGRRTQREFCALLGVSRSTLSFHVTQLERRGILACEEAWPEKRYTLADPALAARLLASLAPRREPLEPLGAIAEDADATTAGAAPVRPALAA